METPDKIWTSTARHHQLPDTADARQAFYHGARYALGALVDAMPDDVHAAGLTLNDHLAAFMRDVLSRKHGEQT